ncbi:MAG: asparagine synthase (glutamine-hydrolyzing) [Proteobacteria bacterium]|nr:asparagine synthase (glutamine-hydrolyzing) [Pseudomonadota bacterium]
MCGIAGIIPRRDTDPDELSRIVNLMLNAIVHRGPDDQGILVQPDIAIGIRRLSIIDVAGGKQPITCASGMNTIVFNGELYNYRTLRKELESRGVKFDTSSDTEIVVEAYDAWGEQALQRFEGMFGFAVWDHQDKSLLIARDWVGQKSVYFSETTLGLIFASEIKALLASGLVKRELDTQAMFHYMSMRYLPGKATFFTGISKLPAAHTMRVTAIDRTTECYWNRAYQPKHSYNESELIDELDDIMQTVVSEHLMSDVPLGSFLSGGIDSSLIVAYASRALKEPLKTFSVGVNDDSQSELPWAKEVANRYNTNHFETISKPDLAMLAPAVVHAMEEPADPLAFGYYVVSKIAAEHVTVCLGGDGGDEIFSGYDRYKGQQLAEIYAQMPALLRHGIFRRLLKLVPDSFGYNSFATKLRWIDQMADSGRTERYADSAAFHRFPHTAKKFLFTESAWNKVSAERSEELLQQYFESGSADAFIDKMLYADLSTRMADHQLPIVDKMSMAHSLEVRSPFLDKRVVEFASKIPASWQMKQRRLKYIPRKLGERYLSKELLYRKKQGFGFPLALWIRDSLRPLIQKVIDESYLVEIGIFRRESMQNYLDEHVAGSIDHNYRLWMLLNLELFYRHYIREESVEQLNDWVAGALGQQIA